MSSLSTPVVRVPNQAVAATVPTTITQVADNRNLVVENNVDKALGAPIIDNIAVVLENSVKQVSIATVPHATQSNVFVNAQTPLTFDWTTSNFVKFSDMYLIIPMQITITGQNSAAFISNVNSNAGNAVALFAAGNAYNFSRCGFMQGVAISNVFQSLQFSINDNVVNPTTTNGTQPIKIAQYLLNQYKVTDEQFKKHIAGFLSPPIPKTSGQRDVTAAPPYDTASPYGTQAQIFESNNFGALSVMMSEMYDQLYRDLTKIAAQNSNAGGVINIRVPLRYIIPELITAETLVFPPGVKFKLDVVLKNSPIEVYRSMAGSLGMVMTATPNNTIAGRNPEIEYISYVLPNETVQQYNNWWINNPLTIPTTPIYIDTKTSGQWNSSVAGSFTQFELSIQMQQANPAIIMLFFCRTTAAGSAYANAPAIGSEYTYVYQYDPLPVIYKNVSIESTNAQNKYYADTDFVNTSIIGSTSNTQSGYYFKTKTEMLEDTERDTWNRSGAELEERFFTLMKRTSMHMPTVLTFSPRPIPNQGPTNRNADIGITTIKINFFAQTIDAQPIPTTWTAVIGRVQNGRVAINADRTTVVTTMPVVFSNNQSYNTMAAVSTTATNYTNNAFNQSGI